MFPDKKRTIVSLASGVNLLLCANKVVDIAGEAAACIGFMLDVDVTPPCGKACEKVGDDKWDCKWGCDKFGECSASERRDDKSWTLLLRVPLEPAVNEQKASQSKV